MSIEGIRLAIDEAAATDTATFARRTRNAIAQAVVAEAVSHETPCPARHQLPLAALEQRVGPELAGHLASVYAGGADWTSHAIDALAPLNALARSR